MGGYDFLSLYYAVSKLSTIQTVLVFIIPAILAVTLHEAAHAYVANYFGDDTAERMGRVSLNPAVHIDPIGTILLPIVTMLMPGGFFFGYAKPVPVMVHRLRNPKKDMPMVALAGPVANFVMALIWMVVLIAVEFILGRDRSSFFFIMAAVGVLFNLVLFAFNMLPILPLDGGRVLMGILPDSVARSFSGMERYGMMIVLVLAFATNGALFTYWVHPIAEGLLSLINLVTYPIRAIV